MTTATQAAEQSLLADALNVAFPGPVAGMWKAKDGAALFAASPQLLEALRLGLAIMARAQDDETHTAWAIEHNHTSECRAFYIDFGTGQPYACNCGYVAEVVRDALTTALRSK